MLISSNTKNKNIFISNGDCFYDLNDNKDVTKYSFSSFINREFYITKNMRKAIITTKPFHIQKYEDNTVLNVKEYSILFKSDFLQYKSDSNMLLVSFNMNCNSEEELYVASMDEIYAYTMPIFVDEYNNYSFPFIVNFYEKGFFGFTKFKELFSTEGIPQRFILNFTKLVSVLNEFLKFQEIYVHNCFLDNILSILHDAKQMLISNIYELDKEELFNQTLEVMDKLYNSINDVSPYDYQKTIKTVEECIAEYYEREQNEKQKKEAERRRLLEEKKKKEELEKKEMEKKKKDYLERINAKSQLLDYFNSNFAN